jgi:hypothetical protein
MVSVKAEQAHGDLKGLGKQLDAPLSQFPSQAPGIGHLKPQPHRWRTALAGKLIDPNHDPQRLIAHREQGESVPWSTSSNFTVRPSSADHGKRRRHSDPQAS